jgi:hypothetical protein
MLGFIFNINNINSLGGRSHGAEGDGASGSKREGRNAQFFPG